MTSKRRAVDDLIKSRETEDDVEGHLAKRKAADDLIKSRGTEDDVEGHLAKRKAADDLIKSRETEDDVEGHMIGAMNPVLARELARAKERDVQRGASRGNLISEAKRAIRRKD